MAKNNNQKCAFNRNVKEYKQQHPQQAHIHPIAHLAQTPLQVAQYVPENGAHDDQSQGHWRGQYI